ncbi:MAG: acyl-CoA dehydrogenase family protein [Myxococcota bacterium]
MSFRPSPDLSEFLSRVRGYVDSRLIPAEAQFLQPRFDYRGLLNEFRAEVKSEGWWAPHLSQEHGGMGLSLMNFARVSEELGRTPLGHHAFHCHAPDVGNTEILIEYGSTEQKSEFLKPLLNGSIHSCFAMTEPDSAGSNPLLLKTTARRDGDDYVLDGHKWFTTAADGAAFAIVMAVSEPEADSPYARASMLIVPTDTPGYELVRNVPVMGEPHHGYFSHGEVRLSQCRIPARNLLGATGAGFLIAQQRLGPGRIHHCMRWIGICERAFELMCERAATREIAPGKVLGSRQLVQGWIADSRAEIDAARLLVLNTAEAIDQDGVADSRIAISEIKYFVAGVLDRVLDRAIQTHGALGLTDDLPLAFWYRHERGARVYDGADEVHKTVVARQTLKRWGASVR